MHPAAKRRKRQRDESYSETNFPTHQTQNLAFGQDQYGYGNPLYVNDEHKNEFPFTPGRGPAPIINRDVSLFSQPAPFHTPSSPCSNTSIQSPFFPQTHQNRTPATPERRGSAPSALSSLFSPRSLRLFTSVEEVVQGPLAQYLNYGPQDSMLGKRKERNDVELSGGLEDVVLVEVVAQIASASSPATNPLTFMLKTPSKTLYLPCEHYSSSYSTSDALALFPGSFVRVVGRLEKSSTPQGVLLRVFHLKQIAQNEWTAHDLFKQVI